MDLEFLSLFNRTNQWDTTWLKTKESFKEVEIAVLLKLNKSIADFEKEKRNKMQGGLEMLNSIVFFILSRTDILLALNNKGEKSISKEVFEDIMGSFSLLPIWDRERRTLTLIYLFQKFTKVFEVDDFVFLLKDAYSLVLSEDEALNLISSSRTQDIIEKIVRGYIKCGRINEAYHITISHLEDSIISTDGMKFSNAIKDIALAHASNGNIEEAKLMVKEIPESSSESIVLKSGALAALSSECSFQNKFEEAIAFMSDAKLILNDLFIDYKKYQAYKSISIELTKQNKWEEAMELTKKIPKNYWFRSSALCAIARVNNSSMNFDHSIF
jgi:tetratricopeptide (TPR) repeat protein